MSTLTRGEAHELVDTCAAANRLAALAAHWSLAGWWHAHAVWTADQMHEHVNDETPVSDESRANGPKDSDDSGLPDFDHEAEAAIAAVLIAAGFAEEHTGGGCMAYHREAADGSSILVTESDGAELPRSWPVLVGFYDADGQTIRTVEPADCAALSEAIK